MGMRRSVLGTMGLMGAALIAGSAQRGMSLEAAAARGPLPAGVGLQQPGPAASNVSPNAHWLRSIACPVTTRS